ncbi:hypothetical protein LTR17_010405 [Elasticomyces elasticus]|nr:hypothetical protein LTR17_010405 [Elasticomyces elasticus]
MGVRWWHDNMNAANKITALLAAGCTASTGVMSNIYILSVAYHVPSAQQGASRNGSIFAAAAEGGQVIVRSSYFGLCARDGLQGTWVCASGAFGLNSILDGRKDDPLDAIGFAAHFKSDVIFPGLL